MKKNPLYPIIDGAVHELLPTRMMDTLQDRARAARLKAKKEGDPLRVAYCDGYLAALKAVEKNLPSHQ